MTVRRILIIDDSPEDRRAARRVLTNQGAEFQFHEAAKGEGVLEALRLRPDCILIDQDLPDLNGLDALSLLRDESGALKFATVMLTGVGDESLATAAVQRGAHEFVAKTRIGDGALLRSVDAAIEKFRLSQANRLLEETKSHLAALLRQSREAIVSFSFEGVILSWNPAAESIFGYTAEEAAGRNIEMIVAKTGLETGDALAELRAGASIQFETLGRRKDGAVIEIEVAANAFTNGSEAIAGVSVIIRNLTDMRRAEVSRRQDAERLQLALGAAEIGTYEINLFTNVLSWDDRAAAIWGRDGVATIATALLQAQIVEDDRAHLTDALESAIAAGEQGAFAAEFRIRRHGDKAIRWLAVKGRAFFENGRPAKRVGVMLDITDKKNAQEDLRRREEFLRWIIRNAPIPIMLHTLDGEIVDVNHCFTHKSGYTQRYIPTAREWFMRGRRLSAEAADERFATLQQKLRGGGELTPDEMTIWTKAGEERLWIVYSGAPFVSPEGAEIAVAAALDVTARRQSEEVNAHLAAIIASSNDAIYSLTPDCMVISWNASAERMLGYRAEEIIGRSVLMLVPPTLTAERDTLFEEAKQGAIIKRETKRQRKDGAIIDVLLSMAPMRGPDGGVKAISVLARDITVEKRVMAELWDAHTQMAQQAAELDAIFEVLNVPITVYNRQGEIVRTNAASRAVWGISPDQSYPINFNEVAHRLSVRNAAGQLIDGADLATCRALAGHAVGSEEYQITSPSGCRRDFEAAGLPLVVGENITGAVSVWHDITEHKRKDEQASILLRELSHRSKNLLTVIESILRQSAKSSGSKDDFVRRFSERLHALANSHDLLAQHNSLSVSMTDLIFSQLGHHWEPGQQRLSMSGLGIRLKPDAAQIIGMALHELSTNAAKYGALSNQTGKVAISWRIDAEKDQEPMFELRWVEQGGPPVVAPAHRGFGYTVIQRVAGQSLKGHATLDYAPEGLVWVLRVPRSAVTDSPANEPTRAGEMRSDRRI